MGFLGVLNFGSFIWQQSMFMVTYLRHNVFYFSGYFGVSFGQYAYPARTFAEGA